jgi:hypothetical protein
LIPENLRLEGVKAINAVSFAFLLSETMDKPLATESDPDDPNLRHACRGMPCGQ